METEGTSPTFDCLLLAVGAMSSLLHCFPLSCDKTRVSANIRAAVLSAKEHLSFDARQSITCFLDPLRVSLKIDVADAKNSYEVHSVHVRFQCIGVDA